MISSNWSDNLHAQLQLKKINKLDYSLCHILVFILSSWHFNRKSPRYTFPLYDGVPHPRGQTIITAFNCCSKSQKQSNFKEPCEVVVQCLRCTLGCPRSYQSADSRTILWTPDAIGKRAASRSASETIAPSNCFEEEFQSIISDVGCGNSAKSAIAVT